jgi:hypothetical protein
MIKKIGFAAAIALVAVSAMASNFRVADQVYVPAAGHIGTFVSDLFVSNTNADSITVSVIAANGEQGTQQNFANLFTLAPNERRELPDFIGAAAPNGIGQASFLGQLIFNGCLTGGNCDVTTCDGGPSVNNGICRDFRNLSVESRIYSAPAGSTATTGQLFSGYPWYSYVTQEQSANDLHRVFITGIRVNTQYRTNIGLVNASQFSFTTFRVKLFNGATGAQIGSDFTRRLAPLGTFQSPVNGMFPAASGTNMWVQVTQETSSGDITSDAASNGCPTGCPGFFAYGSVLDNQTTDATTLEPQYFKALTDAQIGCIFPAPGSTATCKGAPAAHRAVRHKQ